jgi:carboxylesterase
MVGALCIHGFTGNPSSMRGVAEAFAAAGYHVELPRLPGHGTAVSDMIPTRWSDWKNEVAKAYATLSARVDKVVVAGLSMGGSLTLSTALDQPEVSGIVCINPACQPQAAEMVDMVKGMLAEGTETFPGIGSDIADPDVKESSYSETPLAPLVSMVEDGITPMVDRYPSSRVPMLLITSSRFMPMPLSLMVTVRESLSKAMRIFKSLSPSYKAPLEMASKRNLSAASDALEMSSRKTISLLL